MAGLVALIVGLVVVVVGQGLSAGGPVRTIEQIAIGLAVILAFVGLIGSTTKRARFLSQMRAAGLPEAALAKLVCPIGVPGVEGKEPAVIAAAVAAQLLMARE